MAPTRAFLASLMACAVLVALPACARECAPVLRDGWVRLLPVAMPMTAGFGRIENPCPQPVAIVAVSSPAFEDVSLHETRVVDGVSRMRAVPALAVAANGAAVMEPGGLHLMLMQPRAPLRAGGKVVVVFELKGGGTMSGELVVRTP